MPTLSKTEIETAAKRRVVFGHQSVGLNILAGVRALASENGIEMSIAEGRSNAGDIPGITHFKVGQNGDPLGKINDFVTTMSTAPLGRADIAMMKLCYVDFNSGTDALLVAKEYTSAIEKLRKTIPGTRFIAVTTPLTAIPRGPKAWVKKILGRKSTDLADNAKRKQFNDYLRQHFDQMQLFDIAKLEAETVITKDGTKIEVMRRELTPDGGHLNNNGQRLIGAALLRLLAKE